MHEVKWENANALEIELLVAMAMDVLIMRSYVLSG